MTKSPRVIRRQIAETEAVLEALRQAHAEALWKEFEFDSPADRLTLHRVVAFFLEKTGPQPTEVIAEFLQRIGWPSKVEYRFTNVVGVQLRQRKDLFHFDKHKRLWHRKSG